MEHATALYQRKKNWKISILQVRIWIKTVSNKMSWGEKNLQNDVCTHLRHKSACTSMQADQSAQGVLWGKEQKQIYVQADQNLFMVYEWW